MDYNEVSIYIFCHLEENVEKIHKICSYCLAMIGDMKMTTVMKHDQSEKGGDSDITQAIDLIIYEIENEKDILRLIELKAQFTYAEVLVITTRKISPDRYLIPEIHPVLMVLKPYDTQKLTEIIQRLFTYYFNHKMMADQMGRFTICHRRDMRYFDYSRIEYFEAREKRIILNYCKRKIPFYGSLKQIEEELPECFVRCHRSFIVNTSYIQYVDFAEYCLYMKDMTVIPVSKKYGQYLRRLTR